uniref:Uncharacterized protein n=1 Tax=Parascaris equorum TaxID=6256 RepID=A0A914S1L7_PAREQ
MQLNAYKSTGDSVGGSKFFNEVGAVKAKNLKWREIVIARRQPRRMFLQSNTVLNEKGDVVLKTYPETFEGIIQSVVDRYSPQIVADLEALWCPS